jgi:hypothetical protein
MWEDTLDEIVVSVKSQMSIDAPVRAAFHNLLVYGDGGHFKLHKDSEKLPGMFGTRKYRVCVFFYSTFYFFHLSFFFHSFFGIPAPPPQKKKQSWLLCRHLTAAASFPFTTKVRWWNFSAQETTSCLRTQTATIFDGVHSMLIVITNWKG